MQLISVSSWIRNITTALFRRFSRGKANGAGFSPINFSGNIISKTVLIMVNDSITG
jgi:hypothetical protein